MYTIRVKQTLDIAFTVIMLPFILIIIIVVSLLIKIDSPNDPIFFIQKRVGYKNKVFSIIKFRTMPSATPNNDFTSKNDNRINTLGIFLRRFRIDEIPQFFNVLNGSMSLIGPRPEQPHFCQELEIKYKNFYLRNEVLPGITGLAQVEYGYVSNFDDYKNKLEFDLKYVKEFSLSQDITVFFKTIIVLFNGFGSR
tara:strand:- start:166 stop:750 length:585 start_codon:yes stop_codon:yes gene_type:complete